MKILVTGGAGFIGSNVVDSYIEAGHEVVIIDNLSTGKRANINPRAVFYEMDIRYKELDRIFEEHRPDILNLHAAQMSVPASVKDPVYDADVNIMGLVGLLQSAVRHRTKKIIFASSGGAVYGEAHKYPTPEDTTPLPMSPYALSKFVSEQYLDLYRRIFGLDYTVLRYANIYGPRQIPEAEAGVVAIFTDNMLSGRPSIVFNYPDEPGGMERDYLFVGDVARANMLALTKGSGEIINIGTGKATRTRDLYRTLYSVSGIGDPELANPGSGLPRPGDIRRSCLVVLKAKTVLGWGSEVSLEDGIRRTVEWRRSQN
ncbi:MAG: NAD-dependent epimerase/dehydratase family protein [Deltaproteobacteria bacterium]|nr:NAD-dependent epimerase/dehydratase family protein [Deltaproteobacteria bacterium]